MNPSSSSTIKRCSIIAALSLNFTTADGALTNIVVFGDSLSDTGNVHLATGGARPNSDYHPNGRYSNGLLWIEHFAQSRGLAAGDLAPSLAGGRNHAFGGAMTGGGLSPAGTPNLGLQIDQFLMGGTVVLTSNDLSVVWGGANDFLFSSITDPVAFVGGMIGNMTGHLSQLIGAGGEHFLVPNLPDLSLSPAGMLSADPAGLRALIQAYNAGLENALVSIEAANAGVSIERMDVFTRLDDLVANPADYGLTNVTTPVYPGSTTGPAGQSLIGDPATSFWWDSIHPTAVGHRLIVPEPSVAFLAILGCLPAFMRRRRGSPVPS